MPEVTIAPKARNDLLDIGRYTQENWGTRQRNKYLTDIANKIAQLATALISGRPRDDIRQGLRSCPCNHHIIFFRRDEDGNVEVLRVLHERMDFDARL